jgi:hypothetical protein
MTHIICRALSCAFWEEGVCGSEEIEYEPDVGCLTFQDLAELEDAEEGGEELDWDSGDDPYDDDDDDWDDDEDDWDEDLR